MIEKIKQWWRSRTNKFFTFVAAFGVVESNFHYLESTLGSWYGPSFVVISLIGFYLRSITTQPLSEK